MTVATALIGLFIFAPVVGVIVGVVYAILTEPAQPRMSGEELAELRAAQLRWHESCNCAPSRHEQVQFVKNEQQYQHSVSRALDRAQRGRQLRPAQLPAQLPAPVRSSPAQLPAPTTVEIPATETASADGYHWFTVQQNEVKR